MPFMNRAIAYSNPLETPNIDNSNNSTMFASLHNRSTLNQNNNFTCLLKLYVSTNKQATNRAPKIPCRKDDSIGSHVEF